MAVLQLRTPDEYADDKSASNMADPGLQSQQEAGKVSEDSLPPQDGGAGAWLFLFGACVFEIVSWGKHTFVRSLNVLTVG